MTKREQNTMQAAAIDRFGGPEVITLQTLPIPEVGLDEVLIRIDAAGVGKWDADEREGKYAGAFGAEPKFPFVLGWDGTGTVAAVGPRVGRFEVGDRVYAASVPSLEAGLYAEYAAVKAENVAHVPDTLTVAQAAAAPWDALTAISGLEDALALKEGETLMVFGASGGIGHIAVQLAKRMGARLLAVASGEDGVALARQQGADAIVDGRTDDVRAVAQDFAPRGLDGALVTAGGEAADRALAVLRDGGRVAYPNGVAPTPNARPGVQLIPYDGRRDRSATHRLNRLIDAKAFEIRVAQTFPFNQVVAAHRMLGSHFLGKLVLQVRDANSQDAGSS